MAQLLVRDMDKETVDLLKQRASKHGRSLQSEVKTILEQAAQKARSDPYKLATQIRKKLTGKKQTDSAEFISEDRKR